MADTYKETRVIEFPDMIARVYIPDLTPAEKARRMKAVHDAAANLLKSRHEMQPEKPMGGKPTEKRGGATREKAVSTFGGGNYAACN